jgi:hypothetical protein
VSVAGQERFRIASATGDDPEAMAWVDERTALILARAEPAVILAAQRRFAGGEDQCRKGLVTKPALA